MFAGVTRISRFLLNIVLRLTMHFARLFLLPQTSADDDDVDDDDEGSDYHSSSRIKGKLSTTQHTNNHNPNTRLFTNTVLDNGVRALFALYYLPIIALIIAGTINAVIHFVQTVVFPAAQHEDAPMLQSLNFYEAPVQAVLDVTSYVASILLLMVPYTTLGIGFLVFCHKLLNCVAEAMVDAYSRYEDCDYALALERFISCLHTPTRIAVLCLVTAVGVSLASFALGSAFWTAWLLEQDAAARSAAWLITVALLIFVCLTAVDHLHRHWAKQGEEAKRQRDLQREEEEWLITVQKEKRKDGATKNKDPVPPLQQHRVDRAPSPMTVFSVAAAQFGKVPSSSFGCDPSTPLANNGQGNRLSSSPKALVDGASSSPRVVRRSSDEHPNLRTVQVVVASYWVRYLQRVRHYALEGVIVFAAWWFCRRGLADAISLSVETLTYLNLPNAFCFTVLSFSCACLRAARAFRWLGTHLHFLPAAAALASPYLTCIAYTFWYFWHRSDPQLHLVALWLVAALVMLLWRSIDLCRAFDVGPNGSVLWRYDDTPNAKTVSRIAPALALHLEEAFLTRQRRPSVVMLEAKADVLNMRLKGRPIAREKYEPQGSTDTRKSFLSLTTVLLAVLPNILAFQSGETFTGRNFQYVRATLRLVTSVVTAFFMLIFVSVLVQETVQPLSPSDVTSTVTTNHGGNEQTLHFNHRVVGVRMRINISKHALSTSRAQEEEEEEEGDAPRRNGADHADDDELGPLCLRSSYGVSYYELAWLSLAAYIAQAKDMRNHVEFVNSAFDSDWQVVFPRGDVPLGRRAKMSWHSLIQLRSAARNITIVAVKGTGWASMLDVLQDISLFLETGFYHLITHVVPGSSLLSSNLVSDFVYLASAFHEAAPLRNASTPSINYHQVVEEFVRNLTTRNNKKDAPPHPTTATPFAAAVGANGDRLLLTGHSLGGAVTNIVGARLGIRSVAFHSPGLQLLRKKLKLTRRQINRWTTTIATSFDVVPHIGGQAGEMLQLDCEQPFRLMCHALESTLETIWRRCGSVRRKFPRILDVQFT